MPAIEAKAMSLVVLSSSFGTMLEYYDFFVYVALTPVLANLFFPATDPAVGVLISAAGFGAAFLARPVGTLIFSPMADRVDRKKAFVVTLGLMGTSTMPMGCLPDYAGAGIAAPVALMALRILQGVALGGEDGSVAVYVMEPAPAHRRGLYTSVMQSTAALGLVLALAIVTGLKFGLSGDLFERWGWRIPLPPRSAPAWARRPCSSGSSDRVRRCRRPSWRRWAAGRPGGASCSPCWRPGRDLGVALYVDRRHAAVPADGAQGRRDDGRRLRGGRGRRGRALLPGLRGAF